MQEQTKWIHKLVRSVDKCRHDSKTEKVFRRHLSIVPLSAAAREPNSFRSIKGNRSHSHRRPAAAHVCVAAKSLPKLLPAERARKE